MLLYIENYLQISCMPATMNMVCIVFKTLNGIFSVGEYCGSFCYSVGTEKSKILKNMP